ILGWQCWAQFVDQSFWSDRPVQFCPRDRNQPAVLIPVFTLAAEIWFWGRNGTISRNADVADSLISERKDNVSGLYQFHVFVKATKAAFLVSLWRPRNPPSI